MLFILAIIGFWLFLFAGLVMTVVFSVFAGRYLSKRSRRKKDGSAVSEEELAAARRQMVTAGVVLLSLLAAFLVCFAVAGIGLSSM